MWKLEPVPTVRYERTYALAGLRRWAPFGHEKRFPVVDADGTARRVDQGWFAPRAVASKWIAAHGAAAMKFERSPALSQPRPIVGETQTEPPLQWVFAPACLQLLAASHAAEHFYYYGTGVFLLAAVAPVGAWTTPFWQATLSRDAGVAPAAVTAPRDHSTKEPSPGMRHTAAECAPASAARKMAAASAQEQKRQSEPRVSAPHLLALMPPPAASPTVWRPSGPHRHPLPPHSAMAAASVPPPPPPWRAYLSQIRQTRGQRWQTSSSVHGPSQQEPSGAHHFLE
ncbi:hypothetical protein ECC02_011035 [Trypanosoma cruzi]|uniref:Uncharacterized protein n=1 Tax=Trypanosoma cruzi TaxID=5693 RepID=A0A7J6XPP3_TRYCR|nr:hypothetical protein ECC02_011035 [Trypanosoma cruzi]